MTSKSINSKDTSELIIPLPEIETQKSIVLDIEKEEHIIKGTKSLIGKKGLTNKKVTFIG